MTGPDLDGRAIALGAAVALAVGVPAGILAQALDAAGTIADDSIWLIVLTGVILAGMGAGGYLAAARRADAPLVHSAAAAVAAYAVVQTIGIVGRVAGDRPIEWTAIPVVGLLAAAAGMAGGIVADHRARRPRRARPPR